jgi:hypothetical protein
MKKCILSLILIAFSFSIYSQPIPPVKVEDCPDVTIIDIPTMDGNVNEVFWSADQSLTIFSLSN